MRHSIYALWTALFFCFVFTSCAMLRPVSEAASDGKAQAQSETVLTVGEYSLVENNGAFTVSSSGETDGTVYEAYHPLRYFDGAGAIQTHHILVSRTEEGAYALSSLSETGAVLHEKTYTAYAFHGDYIILDGMLCSGDLAPIGEACGEVASVTSLENGGVITFAPTDNGAVYSYFRGEATEIPNYATNYRAFPYAQTSCGLLTNDNRYAASHEENLYLYTGGICYRTPIREYSAAADGRLHDRIEATLFGEEGTFYFYRLYYASPQKEMRFLEIHHLNSEEAPGYFRMTEVPRDDREVADWLSLQDRTYEISRCALFPDITWLEDANANFRGYLGAVEKTPDNRLCQTLPDGTQKYYNEHLVLISQTGERAETGRAKYTWEAGDASGKNTAPETVTVTVPSAWTRYDSVFEEHLAYDTHGAKKRMEVCRREGLTKTAWVSELDDGGDDKIGPYTDVTATGHPYTYYFREVQIEKDVRWRIYYFYILSANSVPYTVTVHYNLDYDVSDYFDTVILPAIDSVVIGEGESSDHPAASSIFDPNAYAELIPGLTIRYEFWHRLGSEQKYLYFCSVRTPNALGTAYTDDPPMDFRVYVKEAGSAVLGNVATPLPADLMYDSVLPVLATDGERDMDCRFFLRLTDSGRTFYVSFDNFAREDDPTVFTYAGVVPDSETAALAKQYPNVFGLQDSD